jgi:hypothetical protein
MLSVTVTGGETWPPGGVIRSLSSNHPKNPTISTSPTGQSHHGTLERRGTGGRTIVAGAAADGVPDNVRFISDAL